MRTAAVQLHQRIHNYKRSFIRLDSLSARDLKRQLHLSRERLAQTLALLEAKDFRDRGYALVSDENGKAVKGVAGLHTGQGLRLRFVDGAAETVVTAINPEKL
jgi:exonuclease VII large subunit